MLFRFLKCTASLTFVLKILKLIEIKSLDHNAKLVELIINDQIEKHINDHYQEIVEYFEIKHKAKIKLITNSDLNLEDYVNTGEKGFVKGISDIVVNKINGLEQHHRPMHCTDLIRQVLYVKNHDKWEKDQDKMNLRNAVNKVAKKNENMASVIKETIDYDDTKNCDDYLHHATYFYNALGGDGDEKKNEDDIIKNVLKEVTIDKENGNN